MLIRWVTMTTVRSLAISKYLDCILDHQAELLFSEQLHAFNPLELHRELESCY